MYLECLMCPKLGVSCDGPNFVAMSAQELLEWCKMRKSRLGISNAKLAEMSKTPKGTIDRLFSGDYNDFKYETVRPLVKALVGGDWNGNPCPNPEEHTEELLHKAEEENARLKEYVMHYEESHRHDIDEVKQEYAERIQDLRGQVRRDRVAITTLSILSGIAIALILTFLLIDFVNPNIGFFWLH